MFENYFKENLRKTCLKKNCIKVYVGCLICMKKMGFFKIGKLQNTFFIY